MSVVALLPPPRICRRRHLGTAVRGRDADVRYLLPCCNSLGQSNGRRASDTDDAVPARYPRYSIVHYPLGNVYEGRIENSRVEIWNEGLNAASEGDAAGAADDEGRCEK